MKTWIHSGWFNTHPRSSVNELVNLLEQDESMDQIREAFRAALKLRDGDEMKICLKTNFQLIFRKTPLNAVSVDIVRRCTEHDARFLINEGFELVGRIFDLESADDPPGPNILDLPNSNEVKFKPPLNAMGKTVTLFMNESYLGFACVKTYNA
jgi:hypothetical protein